MRAGLGGGDWAELAFLSIGLGERVGLLVVDVTELLRPGFVWVPGVGRDAGRGFSWAAFWTAVGFSWAGLAGAWGLSAGWVEEDGASAFSRASGFIEVSGKKREGKKLNYSTLCSAKTHCDWVYTGEAEVFTVWLQDFCGLQPHTL